MVEVGDNWSCKSCKAPVKSSPPRPTNEHPVFYRPDALPVAQPTVSKHRQTVRCIYANATVWLTHIGHHHIGYHGEFGPSALNDVGINTRQPQKLWSADGMGGVADHKIHTRYICFSGRCRTYLERSAAARHVCTLAACFSQSSEDAPFQTLLSLTPSSVFVVPVK